MSHFRTFLSGAIAVAAIVGSAAQAGTVVVSGDRYNLAQINTFYNTYGGHTSTIVGSSIIGTNLSNVDLLWAVQPADAYSAAEITAMQNYLAIGGRIAFMGEHGSFAPDENNRINAALTSLGATMSINNLIFDGGFRTASVADGQILAHPLTQNVNNYEYAAFAPLSISGSAQALMLGEENPTSIMMAYQNIGAGSIFLITDQNVWDNAGSLWPSHDNEIMFDNLVEGITGAPPVGGVPEPSSWAMLIAGFGLTGAAMRRRKAALTA